MTFHFLVWKFVFETHVHRVSLKIILALTNLTSNRYDLPSGSRADLQRGPKGQVYGWDGMNGWALYQKFPSILFILRRYIDHVYIYTYIYNQNWSPRFLWVLKFDVKLGVVVKNFKIRAGRWLFFFFCLKDHTYKVQFLILQIIPTNPFGVQQRFTQARSAEFTDGWDGMDGWMDGISKVSFNFVYTL